MLTIKTMTHSNQIREMHFVAQLKHWQKCDRWRLPKATDRKTVTEMLYALHKQGIAKRWEQHLTSEPDFEKIKIGVVVHRLLS